MKSSWRKKLVGLVASGAIVASLVPAQALAEAALVLDSTATNADPAGPGYSLTVSGLENGDTVKYYQIIEQDVDSYVKATTYDATAKYFKKSDDTYTAVDVADENVFKAGTYYTFRIGTQQWKLTKAVDANGDGIVDGTEDTNFGHIELKNKAETSKDGLWIDELVITSFKEENDVVNGDLRQLTPAMVNALSTAVTNNAKNDSTLVKGSGTATDKEFTVANAASGLYMFVAVPAAGDSNYLYKPIFVSADYYNSVSVPEDNTHIINVNGADYPSTTPTSPSNKTIGNAGVFKRSPITIDKKSGTVDADHNFSNDTDNFSDVAVGDTIGFSITVPIPAYTENYVAPVFYISDMLTEGLKLDAGSIHVVVKNGNDTVTAVPNTDYKVFIKTSTETTDGYHKFKNTLDTSSTLDGFVVQFLNDDSTKDGKHDGFLYTTFGAPTATITYKATVTETAKQQFAQQVNQMDNTAKLTYSKDPNFIPEGYYKTDSSDPSDPDKKIPDDRFDTDDPSDETRTMTVPDPENPGETKSVTEDTGLLVDKTRHYTFDIDADVLGRDQSSDKQKDSEGNDTQDPLEEEERDRTSEIRKIWVDSNGKTIQKKKSDLVKKGGTEANGVSDSDSNTDDYGWLEGAEFTLTKVRNHVTTGIGTDKLEPEDEDLDAEKQEVIKFNGNHIRVTTGGVNPTSDGKGYIAMKGLDAGVYILKEIKAPLGYAFNPNVQYRITITPTYEMEPPTPTAGMTPEDGKGGADDLILSSYEVTIECEELDDNMNIKSSKVTTKSVFTAKRINVTNGSGVNVKDSEGKEVTTPASFLNEDGTSNVDPNLTPVGTGGIDVTVTSFGNNETAMVMNKKLGILPATGGSGILFYLGVGGGIAALALVLMNKTKKAAMRTA